MINQQLKLMTNKPNHLLVKKKFHVVTYLFLISMGRTTHVNMDMCCAGGRTHITRNTSITRDMCFRGKRTHITSNMSFRGRGK